MSWFNSRNEPFNPGPQLSLGINSQLSLKASSPSKICGFDIGIKQGEKTAVLSEISTHETEVSYSLAKGDLKSKGFTEGEAELLIGAKSCGLFGRSQKVVQKVKFDLVPPTVSLTSTQHYINQGGADLATFIVSPDAVESGVRVGSREFKGYPFPGKPQGVDRFALFVWSYDLTADSNTQIVAFARDEAGNESVAPLIPAKFFPKEFRRRELPIEDSFIETRVAAIIAQTPGLTRTGDNLKDFLEVNRNLRKANAQTLVDLSKKSEEKFYWKEVFAPLTNAAIEASFADYRSYMYRGEKVDEQVHLGFDLAVVEKHPILAANRGKVLFADYLGIYGNTVLIDHGYGLTTLYGHLTSMDVKVGDSVEKNQKIGNSGTTGLAGGDHLHFSMLIQGVQTNPVEFWDQHWINDHIFLRLDKNQFGL